MAMTLKAFADALHENMFFFVQEFSRQQNAFSRGQITLPHFIVLTYLEREGEATMTKLSRLMGVSMAAMTGSIDRLVTSGAVTRVHDSKDRRLIKVRLTKRGAAEIRRIIEQKRAFIMRIFGELNQKDRDEYLRILSHVRHVMIKASGESHG